MARSFTATVEAEETGGNSSVGRAQPCQGWGRGSESRFPLLNRDKYLLNRSELTALVAELVDAHVSGACVARREGSSPFQGTIFKVNLLQY